MNNGIKKGTGLDAFHPLIQQWFTRTYPAPTDAQNQTWPAIAQGEHLLVTAPTGSGKTLTAFLFALNQLITGQIEGGGTRILYLSPLKALNNDIQRNLLTPLSELRELFETHDQPFPEINVQTRSGDTEAYARQRMLRHPPEILITTPESLNLMLSSLGGRNALLGIQTVILDEIHAVFGSKRGTHLITAIDRLIPLCGEVQRIALSATIKPLDTVAQFVAGFYPDGQPRPIQTVVARDTRIYDLRVRYLAPPSHTGEQDAFYKPMVEACKAIAARNRSTLFFVNSRRLAEKLTYRVNLDEEQPIAFAHHGSLSREIRTEVERRLKAGELKAIIATSSLELGIDIGTLDEVIMIQPPPAIAATTQRLGRAGHQVGATSHGTMYPLDAREIAEALVLAETVLAGDLETVRPVDMPLDVLAQLIISMTGTETWEIDGLYRQIKTSWPYRNLSRELFDSVLNMLAGRYADSRIRELQPRVSIDGIDQTVKARKGALLALYGSGGVIADRGYFQLRHDDSGARIGELDEEFVWEARIGQVLTLGTQSWKIRKITHNDVYVVPAAANAGSPPFWKSEEGQRDYHLALRIGQMLEEAQSAVDNKALPDFLKQKHAMDADTAAELETFLLKQLDVTACELPHAEHLVIEHVHAGPSGTPGNQTILHTLWGGKVNQPFALALEAAWEKQFGAPVRTSVSDYSVILVMSEPVAAEDIIGLIDEANIEPLLRERLESSGYFGARFREAAGISLLIPRRKIGERLPLWVSRLRSQKLLQAVEKYPDFPILLETWRSCLNDGFDLPHLRERLGALRSGALAWTEVTTSTPSPFAQGDAWRQVNEFMYMDDQNRSGGPSQLSDELIGELIRDPHLRPGLAAGTVLDFEQKRQRLLADYAPQTPDELIDWVKERLLIPPAEWKQLCQYIAADVIDEAQIKLDVLPPGNRVASERKAELEAALYNEGDEEAFVGRLCEWLSFYGPITPKKIADLLALPPERVAAFVDGNDQLVTGTLTTDQKQTQVCDRTNYEILLRMTRTASSPAVTAKPISALPCFLATWQGLTEPGDTLDELRDVLENLICYPAKAASWERDILPARLQRYESAWLDVICQERALQWIGGPGESLSFCFNSELDLLPFAAPDDKITQLFPSRESVSEWTHLTSHFQGTTAELLNEVWAAAWRGEITNDSFATVRKGIEQHFKAPEMQRDLQIAKRRGRPSRGGRTRWENQNRQQGSWRRVAYPEENHNLLDQQETNRERVRILLDRYGILFRELLQREQPLFRWAKVFRTLRLMELSGEIVSGHFFTDIGGLQFTSAKGLQVFQRRMNHQHLFWINATDPISPAGMDILALKSTVPTRLASNHLVYRGTECVVVSRSHAKTLAIHLAADDPDLPQALGFMQHLLTRTAQPRRHITIEEINEQPAAESPYVDLFKSGFDAVIEHRHIRIHPRLQ